MENYRTNTLLAVMKVLPDYENVALDLTCYLTNPGYEIRKALNRFLANMETYEKHAQYLNELDGKAAKEDIAYIK